MLEKKKIENADSILLQNLALVDLLRGLHEDDFVNKEYYNNNINMHPQLKNVLKDVRLNNSSNLLLMLFLLLNTAKELEQKGERLNLEYAEFVVRTKMIDFFYDGTDLRIRTDYIKYIRNSISHMNTEFKNIKGETAVVFESEGFNKDIREKYRIKFSMLTRDVGELIDILFNLIIVYLNEKYNA